MPKFGVPSAFQVNFCARVDRFKLASRAHVRAQLLNDPAVGAAVEQHILETGEIVRSGTGAELQDESVRRLLAV